MGAAGEVPKQVCLEAHADSLGGLCPSCGESVGLTGGVPDDGPRRGSDGVPHGDGHLLHVIAQISRELQVQRGSISHCGADGGLVRGCPQAPTLQKSTGPPPAAEHLIWPVGSSSSLAPNLRFGPFGVHKVWLVGTRMLRRPGPGGAKQDM